MCSVRWCAPVEKGPTVRDIGVGSDLSVSTLTHHLRPSIADSGCGVPKRGRPVWAFWREASRRGIFGTERAKNALSLARWLAVAHDLQFMLIVHVPTEITAALVGGTGRQPVGTAAAAGVRANLSGRIAPPLPPGLMDQATGTGAALAFMVAGAVSGIPAPAAVGALVNLRVLALFAVPGRAGRRSPA